MEELFASFFGGVLFSVGLYALVEFIIIVFSKEKENHKIDYYDDETLIKRSYPLVSTHYTAQEIKDRVHDNRNQHRQDVVDVFFSQLNFAVSHDYLGSSYIINVDLYERSSLPDVFISSKDLEFLRLYLSIYYGFDTKIEKQNSYHNVDYLSLIVSWEDPKVPLVVFNKGED